LTIKNIKKHKKEHLSKIASLGCIICRKMGFLDSPAEIHHIKEGRMGKRSSDYKTLPLCPNHHRNGSESYHYSPKKFTEKWGTQTSLLQEVLSYVNCCGGCE
jgi:hypothetical protein